MQWTTPKQSEVDCIANRHIAQRTGAKYDETGLVGVCTVHGNIILFFGFIKTVSQKQMKVARKPKKKP